jgi:hypothetical protein
MSHSTNCPHCGTAFILREEPLGKSICCFKCCKTFAIPSRRLEEDAKDKSDGGNWWYRLTRWSFATKSCP